MKWCSSRLNSWWICRSLAAMSRRSRLPGRGTGGGRLLAWYRVPLVSSARSPPFDLGPPGGLAALICLMFLDRFVAPASLCPGCDRNQVDDNLEGLTVEQVTHCPGETSQRIRIEGNIPQRSHRIVCQDQLGSSDIEAVAYRHQTSVPFPSRRRCTCRAGIHPQRRCTSLGMMHVGARVVPGTLPSVSSRFEVPGFMYLGGWIVPGGPSHVGHRHQFPRRIRIRVRCWGRFGDLANLTIVSGSDRRTGEECRRFR